jgi:hypothetical protein
VLLWRMVLFLLLLAPVAALIYFGLTALWR